MPDDSRPADTTEPDLERFNRSMAGMAEGMERMMAAAIHMQILVLEDTRQMMREMESMLDGAQQSQGDADAQS